MLDFGRCQWLCKNVGCIVSSRAVYVGDVPTADVVLNEVVPHMNKLGGGTILVILCDIYSGLIGTEQGGRVVEHIGEEGA